MAAISKELNRNLTRWILCFGVMIEPSAILLIHFANLKKKSKMTTELQNKVWSILPKEFKEEVKEIYSNAITYHPCGYNHKTDLLKYLFGRHNLIFDAEGEEMLTVPRKKVTIVITKNNNLNSNE